MHTFPSKKDLFEIVRFLTDLGKHKEAYDLYDYLMNSMYANDLNK